MQSALKKIIAFSVILSILLPIDSVYGQNIIFGIKPEKPNQSYFGYTLNPGETIEDAVIASNNSKDLLQMVVLPVDGVTAENGGISFNYDHTSGPSNWISMLGETTFQIKPFHIQRIPFTISIPIGTKPGVYVAGFLAGAESLKPTQTPDLKPGVSINVVNRIGVSVIIHVPGEEICKVGIKSVEPTVRNGKWNFKIWFTNAGNIPIEGIANINIMPLQNQDYSQKSEWKIRYFIPQSDLLSNQTFSVPPTGEYKITIKLTDDKTPTCTVDHTQTVSFGQTEIQQYATQATVIAFIQKPTDTPSKVLTQTAGTIEQIKTTGSPYWYIWISIIVLLIAIGLVIYALSILKKNKK